MYDLGTGTAESFSYVATQCLMNKDGDRVEIPMPDDLVAQYQKKTCASTEYLESAGVDVKGFVNVKDGIKEYFNYLNSNRTY